MLVLVNLKGRLRNFSFLVYTNRYNLKIILLYELIIKSIVSVELIVINIYSNPIDLFIIHYLF